MIRSYRTTVLCDLKLGRKRRSLNSPLRTSSASPSLVHLFSFRQVTYSSNFKDDSLSNYCASRRYNYVTKQSSFCFYSTKNNGIIDNDDQKHDTHAKPQPTVWDQLKSVPNMITLSRLASTPVLCYWIINDQPNLAIVGCFLAGISDVLDGYIAKNHGGSTVLGTYLDPFADKFFINSLAISLWHSGILPAPLIFLWASKDIILLGGMGWFLYREQRTINFFSNSIHTKPLTVTPSILGKANTGLQFATLTVGILTPAVPLEFLQPVVLQTLCWVTGASSIITTLSYASVGKGFKYTAEGLPSKKDQDHGAGGAETNKNMNTKV